MQVKTIDNQLAVGGQITPEDLADLKARGFRSVVCNRPDDEDYGQPSFAEIAAEAQAQGMEARHIPVSGQPGPAQAAEFAAALREMPGPIFAYCRSGGRAAALGSLTGHVAR